MRLIHLRIVFGCAQDQSTKENYFKTQIENYKKKMKIWREKICFRGDLIWHREAYYTPKFIIMTFFLGGGGFIRTAKNDYIFHPVLDIDRNVGHVESN